MTKLGAVIAHAGAHFRKFTPAWICCCTIWTNPGFTLEPVPHPSFLDGRAGAIVAVDASSRLLGELPEVLEQWQIGVPAVALSWMIDRLLG